MHYYEQYNNGELVAYISQSKEYPDLSVVKEITEEEYTAAIEALQAAAEEEAAATPTYEELEAENAALLYQLLTGEEFTEDV